MSTNQSPNDRFIVYLEVTLQLLKQRQLTCSIENVVSLMVFDLLIQLDQSPNMSIHDRHIQIVVSFCSFPQVGIVNSQLAKPLLAELDRALNCFNFCCVGLQHRCVDVTFSFLEYRCFGSAQCLLLNFSCL